MKQEGRLLRRRGTGPALKKLLADLPPYRLRERDIDGFRIALDDVQISLLEGGDPRFELSVTATVIRHCSILACYLAGDPRFGREESIPLAFQHIGIQEHALEAMNLYQFRIAQSRGIRTEWEASIDLAHTWAQRAREFVDRVDVLDEENFTGD